MTEPEPASDWFAQPAARRNLAQKSVRGTLWSAASRVGSQLIRLVSLLALARLLTPDDFGVVGMVMAIIGVVAVLQDLGLSGATIRFDSITHEQVSNLFWLNAGVGLLIALVAALLAPQVQEFYGDPRVRDATIALALGFGITGIATQHRALLIRMLRFDALAKLNLASALAVALVSVAGAMAGGAYWALIAGMVAGNVVTVLACWYHCDWRPGPPRRGVGTLDLLTFGGSLAVFSLMGYVAKNLYSLIIGRQWGAADVGVYGRASAVSHQMLNGVAQPIGQVVPSAMSRLAGEPGKYGDYYYRVCTIVVVLAAPLAFVGVVLPREFIGVVFGAQWLPSASLLMLLSLGVVAQAVAHTMGWIFMSAGRPAAMLAWGTFGWSVIIVATLVGSGYGLAGMAAAVTASAWALLLPGLLFAFRGTPLRLRSLAGVLAGPLAAAGLAGAAAWALLEALGAQAPWLRLVLGASAFAVLDAALLLTVFGQRALLLEVWTHIRAALKSP